MIEIKEKIQDIWNKKEISKEDASFIKDIIKKLERGELRVAENLDGVWISHEFLKKAILLFFRISEMTAIDEYSFDKIPLRTSGEGGADFKKAGVRVVPGSIIRASAFLAKGVIVMPSFINVGAHVGARTMIDTHATIGSCAQIGENCHISDGVTIGGVLEPIQSNPVIIEDECFIGARSVVAEGVIVRRGSVLGAGVILTRSTKIFDRNTGEEFHADVPEYSIVVPGSYRASSAFDININCAIIVKRIDEETRKKTSINSLLRGE